MLSLLASSSLSSWTRIHVHIAHNVIILRPSAAILTAKHLKGHQKLWRRHVASHASETKSGVVTAKKSGNFYFDAGYALFAKRPSRPLPSLHIHAQRGVKETGEDEIRGVTNGDDAVLANARFIGANDGVGAWATKDKGHAALWSRLLLHYWALEAERDSYGNGNENGPDPVTYLQRAFDKVKEITKPPDEWLGTTTASSALLSSSPASDKNRGIRPIVYATQLGDSGILIFRPEDKSTLFRTAGQWHWFDCPRQLGTNSPDIPKINAVTNRIEIQEGDVVLAVTDGVLDNLWEHEVADRIFKSLEQWEQEDMNSGGETENNHDSIDGRNANGRRSDGPEKMRYVAQELVKAARNVAEDPFAESPYMEKAIEDGLSIEGGKLDDISVVVAQCKRNKGL